MLRVSADQPKQVTKSLVAGGLVQGDSPSLWSGDPFLVQTDAAVSNMHDRTILLPTLSSNTADRRASRKRTFSAGGIDGVTTRNLRSMSLTSLNTSAKDARPRKARMTITDLCASLEDFKSAVNNKISQSQNSLELKSTVNTTISRSIDAAMEEWHTRWLDDISKLIDTKIESHLCDIKGDISRLQELLATSENEMNSVNRKVGKLESLSQSFKGELRKLSQDVQWLKDSSDRLDPGNTTAHVSDLLERVETLESEQSLTAMQTQLTDLRNTVQMLQSQPHNSASASC
jgi:chromosome segregation ATPase